MNNKPEIEHHSKLLVREIIAETKKSLNNKNAMNFLVESGFFSGEERDKLINKFDDNTGAKEKIDKFLN